MPTMAAKAQQNPAPVAPRLRVAVLVDLPRSAHSGGHVKGWERLAYAATQLDLPLDLTVFFSGAPLTEHLSPHVTLRQLPPVFSTERLKFLPYLPDHTDLARWHPALATELAEYDVVHTTDAYFAFTRTAERVCHQQQLGLTHSFHTDQPNYARVFTAKAIREQCGDGWLSRCLITHCGVPEHMGQRMEKQRNQHLSKCDRVLVTRPLDRVAAQQVLGPHGVRPLRLGVDKTMFNAAHGNRAEIEVRYHIPPHRLVLLFVGRLDEGKNIYTLLNALVPLVAAGLPLHLVTAGIGPAAADVQLLLPHHSTVAGFVSPADMAILYASADILALASEIEIRSMAMVESLASGLPVLVAEKSGLHRLLPSSPAIRTVGNARGLDDKSSNVSSWQDAIAHLVQTDDLPSMRHAAHNFAAHHLASWQDVLAEDLFPVWQQAAQDVLTLR